MDELFKKVWDFVAREHDLTIQDRLCKLVYLTAAAVCLLIILPINLTQDLPWFVNLADIILGLFSIFCYQQTRNGRNLAAAYIFTTVLLMDLAWFPNAGSQGSITFYFLVIGMLPMILTRGRVRWILTAFQVANLCTLFILEHYYPWAITPFGTPGNRLGDIMTGAFCSIAATALILWVVVSNHDREQELSARYSKELATNEKNYRELVETAQTVILRLSLEGRVTFFNRYAEELFGLNRIELIGKDAAGAFLPKKTSEQDQNISALGEHPNNHSQTTRYELETCCPDGRRVWVSWIKQAILDDHNQPTEFLCVGTDITERKQAEEHRLQEEQRMQHMQKLESLGILAGGIAHDFNNILTTILGNISLARMELNPESEAHDMLSDAEKASLHARDLTQQLLTFSKGGRPVKSTFALEQVIRDASGFSVRGSKARCDISIASGLWAVDADKAQLSQVFNNLLINAVQAMPEGGLIHIKARNRTFSEEDGSMALEKNYVEVQIQDQGIGINEEHLQKIFDPYFTTKESGSGLGLAVVFSIIKHHHGRISVDSQPGKGTTFSILLPATRNIPAPNISQQKSAEMGSGRILVMDDEEMLRNTLSRMLKRLGYEAVGASDGASAIKLYQEARAKERPFDLSITHI